jgi:hypothetical protein
MTKAIIVYLRIIQVQVYLFRPFGLNRFLTLVRRASGIQDVVPPLPESDRHAGPDAVGIGEEYFPVPNFYDTGEAAVKARAIDADRFARKKPEDRRRFKSSLTEPLLLKFQYNGEPYRCLPFV